jgi:hypothetical protein
MSSCSRVSIDFVLLFSCAFISFFSSDIEIMETNIELGTKYNLKFLGAL